MSNPYPYNGVAQDLIKVQDVLKNEYLPFLNNGINTEADPFLEKIKKSNLSAAQGQYGARLGIGGGFGMSVERAKTPDAVAPLYKQLNYATKDGYVDIRISHKDIILGRTNSAAFIDTVTDAMDASYEAAKWNVGRMLFGDGTGLLCNVKEAVTTSSPVIYVDDPGRLIEGLVVDIYAPAGTSASTPAIQVVSVDYQAGAAGGAHAGLYAVTLSQAPAAALGTATSGVYAKLYVQGSKDREITGLSKIFAPASSTTTDIGYEIYGVTKSNNAWVNPYVVDADNKISDVVITDAIRLSTKRNGKIDMVMAGPEAFKAYEYYMREAGVNTNIVEKRRFVSGSAGYDIMFGDRIATLIRNEFVPTNEMWCVDTNQFELRQTGWNFADYQSSVFTLLPDQSVYRALLANYMELICKHPGTCVRIENANADE